jgi:hypothetical protein
MRQIVNAIQIGRWFNSGNRDAQELLPHLVRKLIVATLKAESVVSIRIPVGDQISLPGYDGVVETTEQHAYVPFGKSVWEMGTGEPRAKAESDYRRRSENPGAIDPKSTVFVFVSPHSFRGKDDWIREKMSNGIWRAIEIIEATDLDNWLDTHPGVARWLARQIGVPIDGLRDLEEFKSQEFDARYGLRVSPELIIGGRDESLKELQTFLSSDARVTRIEAESPEEAVAFIWAAVITLPQQQRESLESRILFVNSPEALDYLSSLQEAHLIVPMTPEVRNRAVTLNSPRIRVIIPDSTSPSSSGQKSSIKLPTISRQACEEALVSSGFLRQKAQRIARESKGKLAAIFLMVAEEYDNRPVWTSHAAARELLPILLAGQWSTEHQNDRKALEQLSACSYVDVERTTTKWAHPTGPLVKRGPTWDWLAWNYAWAVLSPFVDNLHVERFIKVANDVFGTPDPRLELTADERWAGAIYGKEHPYSTALRNGIVGSVAHLALHTDKLNGVDGQSIADRFVRDLLGGQKYPRTVSWLSVAPWLPDLAEASPDSFLKSLEDGLHDIEFLRVVFEEGGTFGWSPHTYVLWALERLAWSKEFLSSVTLLLGDLAVADPGGKLSNRPANSLTGIFLPWHLQTDADLDQRLDAIDLLYRRHPDISWRLIVSLFPGETRIALPTADPQWRPWKPYDERKVTNREYWLFVEALVDRAMKFAGNSGSRWADLVRTYNGFRPYKIVADKMIASLRAINPTELDEDGRGKLSEAVRKTLSHHREFRDADWATKEADLHPFDELFHKFQPHDPVEQYKWLFVSWPNLPRNRGLDYHQHMVRVQEERYGAVQQIYENQHLFGLLALAEKVERPEEVGVAASRLQLNENTEGVFLAQALDRTAAKDHIPAHLRMAWGYIHAIYRKEGDAWINKVVESKRISWDSKLHTNLALGLPTEGHTWDLLARWGDEVEHEYWLRVSIHYLDQPEQDAERSLKRLLKAGRPYRALDLAGMCIRTKKDDGEEAMPISTQLILEILQEASTHDPSDEWYPPSMAMISHNVERLLEILDNQNTDNGVLAGLEWTWMPMLEHSERGLKVLEAALSTQPGLFVDVLKLVFRAENESSRDLSDQDKARATQAYRLLDRWRKIPGIIEYEPISERAEGDIVFTKGRVDKGELFKWVTEARELAQASGRLGVCDSRIGHVLAFAPADPDGKWPCEAVRDLFEHLKSEELERGFRTSLYNSRGFHRRGKGGDQERALTQKFRTIKELVQSKWPRTGALLRSIAEGYEREARWHDQEDAIEEFE